MKRRHTKRHESLDDTAEMEAVGGGDSLPDLGEKRLETPSGWNAMSEANKHSDERGSEITDLSTGEYPILRIEVEEPPKARAANGTAHEAAELKGTAHDAAAERNGTAHEAVTATEPALVHEPTVTHAAPARETAAAQDATAGHDSTGKPNDAAKVTFWLSHLESEVSRLQAKWLSIDAEFKTREARIAELQDEVEAREATIARLTAELQAEGAALDAADQQLMGKDSEIAALIEDRRGLDERIAALSTELADAAVAHKATQEEVARAQAETARLDGLLRREQASSAGAAERTQQLLAEQHALRAKLQDLEIYINGRHDRWSELHASLADYKNTLAAMEKTVKSRDDVIAAYDEEKARLAARILDLERQCSELAGRHKEREEAYEELQQKLAARLAENEQLRAENAGRAKETELASQQAIDRQRHIESLEQDIERREEMVKALTAEAEQNKVAIGELTAARTKLEKSVDDLKAGLDERSLEVQALRDEVRASHDQLRLVQGQLAERTTQLASNKEAVDLKLRDIERLTDELHSVQKEAVQARADLETLGLHAAELGRLRGEAVTEADNLKRELAEQRALVARLQTELRSKQATAELLERGVGRITDLGASLAALDQRMHGGAGSADSHASEKQSPQHADFVTTAADDELAAAAPAVRDDEHAELLPVNLLLPEDDDESVVDIVSRTDVIDVGRKLLVTLDGRAIEYPINKKQMTIGRGHGSDIRISSHFVSRVHAKISTNGVATIIEDVGSKNGLLVNSERVRRRVLRDGDVVSLAGELNLRFVDAAH